MPDGEDPKNNFKDYVLGTYDKEPKTAEWASKICGNYEIGRASVGKECRSRWSPYH